VCTNRWPPVPLDIDIWPVLRSSRRQDQAADNTTDSSAPQVSMLSVISNYNYIIVRPKYSWFCLVCHTHQNYTAVIDCGRQLVQSVSQHQMFSNFSSELLAWWNDNWQLTTSVRSRRLVLMCSTICLQQQL